MKRYQLPALILLILLITACSPHLVATTEVTATPQPTFTSSIKEIIKDWIETKRQ